MNDEIFAPFDVTALKARLAAAAASGWGAPSPFLQEAAALRRWRAEHPAEPERKVEIEVENTGTAKPERKRRQRKPTLAAALKQASKAGVDVKGATLAADGSVSLQFGEPQTEQINDLDKWMAKRHAN
jgi:hypothetical protein